MCSFSNSARVRIGYKYSVEERIKHSIDRVMKKSVTHKGFMDTPRLRIGNTECEVSSMVVRFIFQISMKLEYVICESILKLLHIFLGALTLQEVTPSTEQVFCRDDIVIGMNTLNSHSIEGSTKLIPVILKLKDIYGVWQGYLSHFPKANRFTLGSKIDDVFLNAIEFCFLASYSRTSEKLLLIDRCISRIDLLKLLLQLAWDIKAIDEKKYVHISELLNEAGRMMGGWRRQTVNKTPEHKAQEK